MAIFEPPKPRDFHFGLVELSGCLAATHSEALPLILIFLAMFLYGPAWRGGKGEESFKMALGSRSAEIFHNGEFITAHLNSHSIHQHFVMFLGDFKKNTPKIMDRVFV